MIMTEEMEYLLYLQSVREQSGDWLVSLADWVTKFSVSFWPFAIAAMIFWVLDRNAGRRILGGVSFGLLFNGFLKVTFCVLRPWLRDPRIEPWGDSKVAATGYSFPSGHTSFSTALLVGAGWYERKRHIWLTVAAFLMEGLIMFSRNYLGVHTLSDVLAGFAASCLALVIAAVLENWTDKDHSRDLWYMIGGLLLCAVLVLYYETKSFPLVYTDSGSLLVDPEKMKADSFEGIGALSTFVICRYIERRKFNFDTSLSWKDRFIIGTFALIPGYWLFNEIVPLVESVSNRYVARYAWFTVMLLYTMLLVPYIMQQIEKHCKWVNKPEKNFASLTSKLIERGLTISTMESCTAGLIATLITNLDGSSKAMTGSFITYSNEAKIHCGVDRDIIDTYGVYSRETAIAMATASRKPYSADIGVGVTGSLGIVDPDNSDSVPGEVYFAIDFRGEIYDYYLEVPDQGSKFQNKFYVAQEVCSKLLEIL